MNSLFADPANKKNQLLQIKLPFENVDNSLPIVAVPFSTTQFNGKYKIYTNINQFS